MLAGLCTIAFKTQPIEAVLERAAALGVDGIEIWGREPHMAEQFDAERVQSVRAAMDKHGLSPLVYGSYFGSVKTGVENEIQRGKDAVRITQAFGSPILRVWAGSVGAADATDEHRRDVIACFKAICAEAEKVGIVLAIERHRETLADDIGSLLDLIESVESPVLKVNYQMTFMPDEDYLTDIRRLGELVVNVHCHDAKSPWLTYGKRERCQLGDGYVDFPAIVNALRKVGFDGALEVEHASGGDEEGIRIDCAFLKNLTCEGETTSRYSKQND